MIKVLNFPEPEGIALGESLDRFYNQKTSKKRQAPPRCQDCAFRKGTYPNGCVDTTMDALKCVIEGIPFFCAHRPQNEDGELQPCCGWRELTQDPGICKAPWKFSDEVLGK